MNLRSLDLNLLPVLEAVYSERSLTRASETLHITQPAVSNALARLRTHFEDPLFVREGRGVKPTAMAEALMPAVRDALDRLRAGLEPRSAFEPSRSTRVFNISARDAGAFMIAPSLARRLQDIAPGVRIAWTQLNRGAISTELASGRLDLAIDVPGIRGTDLEREPLMTTPYVCVVSKDHPLSGRQMTFEAFLELRHVVVSSRREGRSYVEEVARSHGARITPVMRLPTYMPALEIVKYTDLALTAPVLLAQSPGLVSHDLPGVFPALDSELYWRRENSEDAALTWLRALILDAVTELAG
ncbi:MAG: LysR family transcriptional regulator [Hyphomonas sp.]|jgi:DNA-binding transcriptional LysR family regulator|uniref:Transcriptional regulator, LysR family n=1 Tax=hydrothermal vent metagenome TaxID=652676 RepID=A0A160U1T2_9ZZZZ|nr:LysR family transcriptional regulator [Hyphomonas sp.]MDF1806999.1 LysR family transcriptional regulator [Hyphomonas sp.]|tara:strand:+ start:1367 stop:2266 length:900 start_codon:yes stop_codon:yes gene_type:complete